MCDSEIDVEQLVKEMREKAIQYPVDLEDSTRISLVAENCVRVVSVAGRDTIITFTLDILPYDQGTMWHLSLSDLDHHRAIDPDSMEDLIKAFLGEDIYMVSTRDFLYPEREVLQFLTMAKEGDIPR